MFDPQFSWTPVPGATKYEVEVNSSVDFAPGSKVCCTQLTTSTSLAPTVVFRDNTYYWRVRALDAAGNAGVWNRGPDFVKTFDKVPPVTAPSIKNLHMRDNLADPGTDVDPGTAGLPDERARSSSGTRFRAPPATSSTSLRTTRGICDWGGSGQLARDDLDPVVDAARLRAGTASSRTRTRCTVANDCSRPRPEQAVLRARPREG